MSVHRTVSANVCVRGCVADVFEGRYVGMYMLGEAAVIVPSG